MCFPICNAAIYMHILVLTEHLALGYNQTFYGISGALPPL